MARLSPLRRDKNLSWKYLKEWVIETWCKSHQHLLDVTFLGAMKWRSHQTLLQYAKEYKSKYIQFNCEKNPQLGMTGTFLASLEESIRRKVWELESLPTTTIKLLDVVIRLGDAREVERFDIRGGKKPSEWFFGVINPNTGNEREIREDPEERLSSKLATLKSFV